MIKKLHGLDGYSFKTTQAFLKYFTALRFNTKTYKCYGYSIDLY